MSVAAGPVGRSSEAAGTLANLAPIYSYSKSKGLFAGLSLEGSVIITRGDANAKFYNRKVTAKELLTGVVEQPAIAEALYRALNLKFANKNTETLDSVTNAVSHSSTRQTRFSTPINNNSDYIQIRNQKSVSDQNETESRSSINNIPVFNRPPSINLAKNALQNNIKVAPGRPTPPSANSVNSYQDSLPAYDEG